ncbi:MAG: DUF885 domain-containing protein [Acidimicrobiia bacterium]|nr:DUF885 domain-containing protein [Acidimicrobiia bacterium]
MMRRMRWVVVCALCAACTSTPTASTVPADLSSFTTTTRALEPAPEPDATDFRSVADGITRKLLLLQPEMVTELGAGGVIDADVNYRLADLSSNGRAALAAEAEAGLAAIDGLDGAGFDDVEWLSAEILRWYLEDIVAMHAHSDFENPVNFITGVHSGFPEFMADVHPIEAEQDAEDYVERLLAWRVQLHDLADALYQTAELGIMPTQRSLVIASYQLGGIIADRDAATHPLVMDLEERAGDLAAVDAAWLADVVGRAEAAVEDLFPVLEDLDEAVNAVGGRSDRTPGVSNLPGGDEYYAAVLRHHLSIDLPPELVHERGLQEVDRLMGELTVELGQLGYDAESDFGRAMLQVAGDAGAMPTTNESQRAAVLEHTAETVARAEEVFADMFSVKPEADIEVVRPRPGREGGVGAYYRSPPMDGSRPGVYYLSLGGPQFYTLTMDTTTYHEAIPGHHFQLSVQRELGRLPLHQRVFDFTGYAEGWALYAERLAYEAGLYEDDPLGNVGRLQMELLRAARMVADTGIHWAGWSRDEAIEYLTSLGFHADQATPEVDRYIVWPGQAPAYMAGMLEILQLRDEAEARLGNAFVLADFHDVLLSHGSVPLQLLDEVVEMWLEGVG